MNTIGVNYDKQRYQSKPVDSKAAIINRRIGKNVTALKCQKDVCSFIKEIGTHIFTCDIDRRDEKKTVLNRCSYLYWTLTRIIKKERVHMKEQQTGTIDI